MIKTAKGLNIGLVGAGYVGLVTGACLAHLGYQVVCVDSDEERLASLEAGRVPFYEPGLEELVRRNAERPHFSTDLASVVCEADVVFIAVDTPREEDGSADLSNVASRALYSRRDLQNWQA